MKLLEVDRRENFTVRLFGRNLLIVYRYIVFEIDPLGIEASPFLEMERITKENVDNCRSKDFSFEEQKRIVEDKHVEGFLFRDKGTGELVGYYWCFHKGYDSRLVKIRNCDASLEQLCVFPEYRNRGLGTAAMKSMLNYLGNNGIRCVRDYVRPNNYASLKLHDKVKGWHVAEKISFIRLLRVNIPYRTI